MKTLYFGVWGVPGHFLYGPGGHVERSTLPTELRSLDGPFAGDPAKIKGYYDGIYGKKTVPYWDSKDEEQGQARMHFVAGWTVMAFWDRSGDRRGGSNSNFLAEGEFIFDEMCVLARLHFPAVWARITSAFEVKPA